MPQLLHNSKFVNWFRRTFSLGSNTDVRPELMKDGLYSDALNMRPAQVDGNTGGLETIRGEEILYPADVLVTNPTSYVSIGRVFTNGHTVEFWASSLFDSPNPGDNPPYIRVDGSLITTEQWTPTGAGFNGGALRSAVDSDGTVVFNGNAYVTYNGTTVRPSTENTAIRVNADGALNSIIAQGRQFEEPVSPTSAEFVIQPDGSIVFVGSFIKYDGTTVGRIVRTNAFGVTDSAFVTSTGTGFNVQTLGVDVLPNGQIMVGSNIPGTFDGVAQGGLTRLDATGALDVTWDLGTGFSGGPVYVVLVDTFGDLIVGGAFTSLDGNTYNRVVKLT